MKDENLLFTKSIKNLNEHPNWKMNFLLLILFTIFSSLIASSFLVQGQKGMKAKDIDIDNNTIKILTQTATVLFSILSVVFAIIILFLIILAIIKIFKKNVRNKSILSSVVLMYTIVSAISLLGMLIQGAFNLDPSQYNILSLNILDKNNDFFGSLNIPLILKAYFIALIFHHIGKFSWKPSLIIAILFLLIQIAFGFLSSII